ncbi:MAG: DsbA family protein, partial [Candidatus Methylomirabilales bacterium]
MGARETGKAVGKAFFLLLLLLLGFGDAEGQTMRREEILALLAKGPAKGAETAPITIIEFSDFQCSYCWRFWKQTLPLLEAEYVKQGSVRFVYRHLAILGKQSVTSAQAADCAGEQRKFWEYHDKLFASKGLFGLTNQRLKGHAREIGLDGEVFDRCLDSAKYAQKVEGETGIGLALGLRGTPAFFINGRLLVGAHPFETFQALIEQELKRAKATTSPSV